MSVWEEVAAGQGAVPGMDLGPAVLAEASGGIRDKAIKNLRGTDVAK